MEYLKIVGFLAMMPLGGMAAKIYHTGQMPTFGLEMPQLLAAIAVGILMIAVFKRHENAVAARSAQKNRTVLVQDHRGQHAEPCQDKEEICV